MLIFYIYGYMRGTHKTEIYLEKLCIYSYMLKLQSPSEYFPFDAIHLGDFFFCNAQNSFWIHRFWCLLVLLPFFVSLLPHQQNISLWGFFHLGLVSVGRCILKSSVMKWQTHWKSSKKTSTEARHSLSQQRQLVHWYRLVPRILT